MASAVSYEYLKAIQGVPGGIPTLDDNGEIPEINLPDIVLLFKGQFADEAELIGEWPLASLGNYAFVDDTASFWYWNAFLMNAADPAPAWCNQEITEEDYLALSLAERSGVPYLVIPPLYVPPAP